MTQPTKILHVLGQLNRGGIEMRAVNLMRAADPHELRFDFCSLSGKPGELDDEVRRLGGCVHLVPRNRLGFGRAFRALLRQKQYDVVHAHVLHYGGYLVRMAAQCGVPGRIAQFCSVHDGHGHGTPRRIYRAWMHRWIDRHATDILAVSHAAMQAVWTPQWRADPRCRVIYNGLDVEQFQAPCDAAGVRDRLGVPGGVPVYLHVGRFCEAKNHRRLLAVFAEVHRRQPDARLLLVGHGDDEIEQDIRQRIVKLKLQQSMHLLGQRDDVPKLLAAADALVLPSLWEGLPTAVLEAYAAGTPVLASDLPGVRELAEHLPRVARLPLEADDTQWAEALIRIGREKAASQRRAERQEEFRESPFTLQRCLEQYRDVWKRAGTAGECVFPNESRSFQNPSRYHQLL